MMNGDNILYTITDPLNHYHTVSYRDGTWHGIENVAHSIDNTNDRWYTIRKLKQMMLTEVEGKWAGFEWIPIN